MLSNIGVRAIFHISNTKGWSSIMYISDAVDKPQIIFHSKCRFIHWYIVGGGVFSWVGGTRHTHGHKAN